MPSALLKNITFSGRASKASPTAAANPISHVYRSDISALLLTAFISPRCLASAIAGTSTADMEDAIMATSCTRGTP
ncbi:Uncharacterised protein [Mycobacterium tuberculosis]|nr:Uncharacterised protein [Mycobacterium tuberculosis]